MIAVRHSLSWIDAQMRIRSRAEVTIPKKALKIFSITEFSLS
jgi:hypothetical protein